MEGTTKRLKKDEIMVDAFKAILQRCPGALLPFIFQLMTTLASWQPLWHVSSATASNLMQRRCVVCGACRRLNTQK